MRQKVYSTLVLASNYHSFLFKVYLISISHSLFLEKLHQMWYSARNKQAKAVFCKILPINYYQLFSPHQYHSPLHKIPPNPLSSLNLLYKGQHPHQGQQWKCILLSGESQAWGYLSRGQKGNKSPKGQMWDMIASALSENVLKQVSGFTCLCLSSSCYPKESNHRNKIQEIIFNL